MWASGTQTRAQLGQVGVWLGALSGTACPAAREAARRIEAAGYTALWFGEDPADKEPFAHAGLLLSATERISIATGIANIWVRDAAAMRNGAYTLAEAQPGRFTLGIGVSHQPLVDIRGHTYHKPLTAMQDYLGALDTLKWAGPPLSIPVPLMLAALRPKMLALAGTRAAGALSYFTPVEHTAKARETLGPDKTLAVELAVVLETDAAAAHKRAGAYAEDYLGMPNYVNPLRSLGFGDDDVAGRGSDRLLDAIVAWGDEHAVTARVRAHLDGGADHVCLQPVSTDLDGALEELERLAPLLFG